MKKILVLSALTLATTICSFGAAIGTCTNSTLSTFLGNTCTLGDKMFSNFNYDGTQVPAGSTSISFNQVGNEYHVLITPVSGFFTASFTFGYTVAVLPGVPPNVPPATFQIVATKAQSFFAAVPSATGNVTVTNSAGPNYVLAPGTETGGPSFFGGVNSLTTSAKFNPGNAGLVSVELDAVQANTAIPEPGSLALIGGGLMGLAMLLRKRKAV